MNITNRILELDPELKRHNEGHWNEDYIDVSGGGTVAFSSFNDAGVECEVGEFLYSMVRLLKPERVLETGTHWGIGATYMGLGLKDNGYGYLDTFEFLPEIYEKAVERFKKMGLWSGNGGPIKPYLKDVRQVTLAGQYQLMLLDTEPQTRFGELIRFYDNLAPGGFVFIHDLHRHMGQIGQNPDHPDEPCWPWGIIPTEIKRWVKHGVLNPVHFDTPRGFMGFYKRHPNDYEFNL